MFVNVLGVSFFVTVVENLTCKHAHDNLYYYLSFIIIIIIIIIIINCRYYYYCFLILRFVVNIWS